jgi:hypothetical protein
MGLTRGSLDTTVLPKNAEKRKMKQITRRHVKTGQHRATQERRRVDSRVVLFLFTQCRMELVNPDANKDRVCEANMRGLATVLISPARKNKALKRVHTIK